MTLTTYPDVVTLPTIDEDFTGEDFDPTEPDRVSEMLEEQYEENMSKPNVLVTGCAGFIGYHVSSRLLKEGYRVVGFDNMNHYYDVKLKEARMERLLKHDDFSFRRCDLAYEDDASLYPSFAANKFDYVVHLAAQAGVRYSLKNPNSYVQSNVVGFLNLLELCRHHKPKHLIYASSSSVYGTNPTPFVESQHVDCPASLYAVTKVCGEQMARLYSQMFDIHTTGLRFFTVYGPWGRPDMAMFKFTEAIETGQPIDLYNGGNLKRDFTYIDDIVEGVYRILKKPYDNLLSNHRLFNIGGNRPILVTEMVKVLEECLGKKAKIQDSPMQPGDVFVTQADTQKLWREVHYIPETLFKDGVQKFVDWYRRYHKDGQISCREP